MHDLSHDWNGDLVAGPGGDLALVAGADAINQRVCRRLLTNPGDYIWNLSYGGGLGQFVGLPANPAEITAIVATQLQLESAIPKTPAPQIATSAIGAARGSVMVSITYADPTSLTPVTLNIAAGT